MKELVSIFLSFAKVGVLTFGGGYAMLPMLKREIVEKRGWATEEEIMDYFAIGQSTPGVIAVNTSTFVGYYRKGVPGAIAATVGVVFPSLVIITVLAAFIQGFYDVPIVKHALAGITAAVAVLIFNAIVSLWKKGVKGLRGMAVFVIALTLALILDVPMVVLVAAAVCVGVVCEAVDRRRRKV